VYRNVALRAIAFFHNPGVRTRGLSAGTAADPVPPPLGHARLLCL